MNLRTGLIYLVTSPSGGRYVGQTIQKLSTRWNCHVQQANHLNSNGYNTYLSNAIRKYGSKNFKREILLNDIPKYKLDLRLMYWIEYYHSFYKDNKHGYNLTRGEASENGLHKKISVCQYDTNGNLINTFESISLAVRITGVINANDCITKKYNFSGGYYWKLMNGTILKHIDIKKRKNNNCRYILQYSIDGLFIKSYESVKQAKEEAHIAHIECAACGRRKATVGFIWKYVLKPYDFGKKKINKFDLGRNYICSYDSLTLACKAIGIKAGGSISLCANGKLKNAYGFIWSYEINERRNEHELAS